jgi:hypothetical protein
MDNLKLFIKETIKSILLEQKAELDEVKPPSISDALEAKLVKQYSDQPGLAYATMWSMHNKMMAKRKRKAKRKSKAKK